MNKTTLYYFSATGNSLAAARLLAKVLDVGSPVSVPGSLINEDPYIDARGAKAVGFIFPVQRATIPEMLRGFIQSMPVSPDCYYFAVSTYSLFGSNEFWDIDEILVSKGAALNYAAGMRMMGSVGLVQPSNATISRRLEHMERQIEDIATAVAYHQENYFPRSNRLLGWAVRVFTNLRRRNIVFHIDKRCKSCGICALVCPAQNIALPQKGSAPAAPIRSDKCEACFACVHWCPAAAISTSMRRHIRYHNPTVQPEELNSSLPDLSANTTTGDAFLGPESKSGIVLDAELAAALREDLLAPTNIESWLNRTSGQGQAIETPDRRTTLGASGNHSMNNADIVKALSDLES